MDDVDVRISAGARDRLAAAAAEEGLSLRAYLTKLADTMRTPADVAAEVERARDVLREWGGYDPALEQERALDADLCRRLAAG